MVVSFGRPLHTTTSNLNLTSHINIHLQQQVKCLSRSRPFLWHGMVRTQTHSALRASLTARMVLREAHNVQALKSVYSLKTTIETRSITLLTRWQVYSWRSTTTTINSSNIRPKGRLKKVSASALSRENLTLGTRAPRISSSSNNSYSRHQFWPSLPLPV